jgi:hypothetical protein
MDNDKLLVRHKPELGVDPRDPKKEDQNVRKMCTSATVGGENDPI